MDDDAVYYMRQRGLSEAEAAACQLTGFVNDVVSRLGEGPLAAAVLAMAEEKIARTPAGCAERMPAEGDAGSVAKETYCGDTKENRQCVRWGKPCRTEAEPRSGRMLPGRKQDGTGQEAG